LNKLNKLQKKKQLIIGGIYREDNNDPDYDGCYALCMGSDQFYFIFNEITNIEEEVEIACAHRMRLVEGYTLVTTFSNDKWKWQIRNSSIKNQPNYILQEGNKTKHFKESLKPFMMVFSK